MCLLKGEQMLVAATILFIALILLMRYSVVIYCWVV